MRPVTATLLIVVLISVPGFGWLLSKAYQHLSFPDNGNDPYRQLVQQFTMVLNSTDDTESLISQWENEKRLAFMLTAKEVPITIEHNVSYNLGELPQVIRENGRTSIVTYLDSHEIYVRYGPFGGLEERSLSGAENAKLRLILTVVYYGAIAIVIWLCLVPLIRRLDVLRSATRHFGGGNLQTRIKPGSLSYTKDIEKGFNQMAQRIQTLVEDNKMLGSAVSHDLRTPLNRLRLRFDILAEKDQAGLIEEDITSINNNLDTMENLIKLMLEFSRLDHRLEASEKSVLNLNELVSGYILNSSVDEKELKYDKSHESTNVIGNAKYLERLLSNLIENAVKFSRSTVVVSLRRIDSVVQISVADDGPGIPEASRENLIKPFERGEDSERRNSAADNTAKSQNGYGLGLSIADRIARWHGSEVVIADSELLGGAEISIALVAIVE